jgi:hypothetical protein
MAPHTLIPMLPHRTVSRRQLLHGLGAIAASSALSGCGIALVRSISSSNGAPPATPPPTSPPPPTPPSQTPAPVPQPLPIGAITSASLNIATTTAGSFEPGFLGLAYEKQSLLTPLFTAANTDLVGLFRCLGPGVLRIGGTSVDHSVWTSDGQGQTLGQVAPSDIAALASFLRATGWSCIYGINLGGSATGANTPALAAAEVAYVAQQLGSALLSIQLGSECEAYGSSFYPGNWSVEIFESLWQQYRAAILSVTPTAPFSGPAAATDLDSWTLPFGEYVTSSQINLLTQQTARGPASNATIDDLISSDPAFAAELLTLHYGAQSIGVPFRIDALSSYADGGAPGVSNTYASSLWAIDTIFQAALAGASGVNYQSGGQTPDAVIADSNGALLAPQPAFYGLLLASMAGVGTLLTTQLSAGPLNVTAYALQSTSGSLSLVLVNKDTTQNLDVSIVLPQAMSTATLQQLTQHSVGADTPSLVALSGITLQGATVASDGAFQPNAAYALTLNGTQLSCYVPALSAVLIQLT